MACRGRQPSVKGETDRNDVEVIFLQRGECSRVILMIILYIVKIIYLITIFIIKLNYVFEYCIFSLNYYLQTLFLCIVIFTLFSMNIH